MPDRRQAAGRSGLVTVVARRLAEDSRGVRDAEGGAKDVVRRSLTLARSPRAPVSVDRTTAVRSSGPLPGNQAVRLAAKSSRRDGASARAAIEIGWSCGIKPRRATREKYSAR